MNVHTDCLVSIVKEHVSYLTLPKKLLKLSEDPLKREAYITLSLYDVNDFYLNTLN